ncbi:MAG: helicase-related protein [Parcubacteria group bacterium]
MHSRLGSLNAALVAADACGARAGRRLRGYQIEGVSWGIEGSYLNSFSVGLGKTATAIVTAVALNYDRAAFVVPAHLFNTWLEEIVRWAGVTVVYELLGNRRLRIERCYLDKHGSVLHREQVKELPDCHWLLVSHETVAEWGRIVSVARQGGILATEAGEDAAREMLGVVRQPDLVVVDEVHNMGHTAAARTGGLHALCRGARRVIGASATLLSGGTHRLWGPLSAVSTGWGSYNTFIERYCGAERDGRNALRPGLPTNVAELKARMAGLVLRYAAADFAHELPEETIQRVGVRVDRTTTKHIGDAVFQLQKALRTHRGEPASSHFALGEIQALRNLLAETKLEAVADLCRDLVASGERVLVWCWHHAAVERIAEVLGKTPRVVCYTAHGGCSKAWINNSIDKWSITSGTVLAATTELLGTGVDMLARVCRLQVFLEMPWKVDRWVQARGRLVRMSQTQPVMTYVAVADVPFEASLFDRLLTEARATDPLLGDNRGGLVAAALGLDRDVGLKLNEWFKE